MLRNGHVRFGGRVGETDRRQRRHPRPTQPLGTLGEVRDPGLLRVQPQPESVQHRHHQLAGLLGLRTSGGKDHQVICVLHQHPEPLPATLPRLIEHVQGDVRKLRMSASSTHAFPRQVAVLLTVSSAWCAERSGRNP